MAGIGDESVADMLENLHLTTEEEEDNAGPTVEWALVGKVLSLDGALFCDPGRDETGMGEPGRFEN